MVPLVKAADETRSEEEMSKSKLSSFWTSFLYMLIKNIHKLAILAPINFSNCHFTWHTFQIKIAHKPIT